MTIAYLLFFSLEGWLVRTYVCIGGKHNGVKGIGRGGECRQCGGVWGTPSSCRSLEALCDFPSVLQQHLESFH